MVNWKKAVSCGYVLLVLFLLYVPILFVVLFSFSMTNTVNLANLFRLSFSFEPYRLLFADVKLVDAFVNTVVLALTASAVSTLLGSAAAIGIYNSRRRAKAALTALNQIPVLNAEIVTAVSLSLLFVTVGMAKGFLTLCISHIVFCTPYVVLSVLPKLKQMNKDTYEAALDLGATPLQALRKVVLPEILPGVVTGFVLAFTLSIDDFVITIFNTSGFTTLSKYIYETATRTGLTPQLRALSTLIFLVVLTVLLLVNFGGRRKKAPVPPAAGGRK